MAEDSKTTTADGTVDTASVPKAKWYLSNRVDDRVVLWEQDPAHPGGECFIGGSGPDCCGLTPAVAGALRQGLIVEIPEPPAKGADGEPNRKKPLADASSPLTLTRPDMPGGPIRLGRDLDPDLVPAGAQKKVEAKQEQAGSLIPADPNAIVPKADGTK